jgi:hypothetical protein
MCEGGLWPLSGSLSVFGKLPGKIRLLELVSSNSENISCVAFLKHKNSRKHGTGTVASCQLVSSGNRITNATKCNETQGKWCKNKHGASKIIDSFDTYH